jgi:hypothetical protein
MAISRGEVSSPSTPSIPLGVPDVSRLCPVQDRISKARYENGLPAQSKSIERLFGRGRQSCRAPDTDWPREPLKGRPSDRHSGSVHSSSGDWPAYSLALMFRSCSVAKRRKQGNRLFFSQ